MYIRRSRRPAGRSPALSAVPVRRRHMQPTGHCRVHSRTRLPPDDPASAHRPIQQLCSQPSQNNQRPFRPQIRKTIFNVHSRENINCLQRYFNLSHPSDIFERRKQRFMDQLIGLDHFEPVLRSMTYLSVLSVLS